MNNLMTNNMKKELFFSTDIESDGPIPAVNSMLSFASAAFDPHASKFEILDTFSANLELLEGAKANPKTDQFWKDNWDAYQETRQNMLSPDVAMVNYVKWIKELCQKHNATPVFAAYPAGYDFMFVYWYLIRFAEESPFSFSAFDLKSYASAYLKLPYRQSTKRNIPKKFFTSQVAHSHVALDDAIEQGELIYNFVRANLAK